MLASKMFWIDYFSLAKKCQNMIICIFNSFIFEMLSLRVGKIYSCKNIYDVRDL